MNENESIKSIQKTYNLYTLKEIKNGSFTIYNNSYFGININPNN